MTVSFSHAVLCDDIRREENGKFLIIGMYTGGFAPQRFPLIIQPAFAIWARADEVGIYNLDFQIFLEPNHHAEGGINVEVEINDPDEPLFVPIKGPPINIGGPGKLKLIDATSGYEVFAIPIGSARNEAFPTGFSH